MNAILLSSNIRNILRAMPVSGGGIIQQLAAPPRKIVRVLWSPDAFDNTIRSNANVLGSV